MKTLAQFKAENQISEINLLQGKGRKYAQVKDLQLVVSKQCELAKPLFVIPLTKALDETKEQSPENSVVVPNTFLLINASTVKQVESI